MRYIQFYKVLKKRNKHAKFFFLFYILQSLLTKVLHVEVGDASSEMKSLMVPEIQKKDETKLKEKSKEKLEKGIIEKEISRDYKSVSSTKVYKH